MGDKPKNQLWFFIHLIVFCVNLTATYNMERSYRVLEGSFLELVPFFLRFQKWDHCHPDTCHRCIIIVKYIIICTTLHVTMKFVSQLSVKVYLENVFVTCLCSCITGRYNWDPFSSLWYLSRYQSHNQ